MNQIKRLTTKYLHFCILALCLWWPCASAFAFTCNDNAAGNWNTPATWTNCGGGVPGAADAVVIDSHAVSLAQNQSADDVTISGGALDLNTFRLNVNGSWTYSSGTFTPDAGTVMFTGTGAETLTSGGAAFNNVAINDGLVGYWRLDEAAANSCAGGTNDSCDSSGYGNDGAWQHQTTSSSTVAPVNFASSHSAAFDGNADYIRVADDSVLNPGTAITLACWVKYTNTGDHQQFILKPIAEGSHNDPFFAYSLHALYDSPTTLMPRMWIATGGAGTGVVASTPGKTIAAGEWHHLAGTYDGSVVNLYIDGKLAASTPAAGSITNPGTPVYMGVNGSETESFSGQMDDVRIYNRALSADEIALLGRGDLPSTSVSGSKLTLEDTLDVNGSLTISSGTLDNKATEDNTITIAGSWLNAGGRFTNDGGVVTFDGATATGSIQAGNEDFYNLRINGIGSTWSLSQDIVIANDLTVDSGTLAASGYDIISMNDWDINAGLNLGSGTHEVDGSIDLTGSTMTAATGTLVLNPASAGESVISTAKSFNNVTLTTTDGLIGWWKLDETAANTCSGGQDQCDSTANSNHCTDSDPATISLISAPVNFSNPRSLAFDDPADVTGCGSPALFDNLSPMSFSVWTLARGYGELNVGAILAKAADSVGTNGWRFGVTSATNSVNFLVDYAVTDMEVIAAINSLAATDFNRWIHWVVTWDGSATAANVHIYKNGTEVTYASQTNGNGARQSDAAQNLRIGNDDTETTTFNGNIDDVRLYNRVLTSYEAAALSHGLPLSHGGGAVTLHGNMDINGDLTLADGTLTAASGTIKIGSDWLVSDGTFVPGTSTVDFDDDTQNNRITGANTFYNLKIDTGTAKTVSFESGKTQTIAAGGSLTLFGSAGQILTVGPSIAATNWMLAVDASACSSIKYLTTTYSDASGGETIDGDGTSVTAGVTNTNWCTSTCIANCSDSGSGNASWFGTLF